MIGIPIGDVNPCRIRPVAHWSIWSVCLLGSVATFLAGMASGWQALPIALNLLLLAILGDNVEDHLGSAWYVAFAMAAAAIGMFAAIPFHGGGKNLCVAIHAVSAAAIGAYAVWFPYNDIEIAYLRFTPTYNRYFSDDDTADFGVTYWPAWAVLGLWVLGNVIAAVVDWNPTVAASLFTFGAGAGIAVLVRTPAVSTTHVSISQGDDAHPQTLVRNREAPPVQAPPTDEGPIDVEPPPPPPPRHYLDVSTPQGARHRIAVPAPAKHTVDHWAVVRLDESPVDFFELSHAVVAVTGEVLGDATTRLRRTRGVIARGLPQVGASQLEQRLKGLSIACRIVPDGPEQQIPDAVEADFMAVDEKGFVCNLADRTEVETPWPQVFLVLGMEMPFGVAMGGTRNIVPAIEVFNAHPFIRMRATFDRAAFKPFPMRAFANEIVRLRRGTPVNPGLSVIAGAGRFGYLSFEREVDRDNYVWWIVQLLRNPAQETTRFTHFLE